MKKKNAKLNSISGILEVNEIKAVPMGCAFGGCPAIFETNRKTFIIIGKKLEQKQENEFLNGRIGMDEEAVEVPKDLIIKLLG